MTAPATTMDADGTAGLSGVQRYLILGTVVLGASLYSTALLTTSTVLPQMQGTMSATQDEIAWAMTFNILATAVVTPMTGWLVARFGAKPVMVWSIASLHDRDADVRHGSVARDAGAVAHRAGRRRRAGGAAVADRSCSTRFRAASTPWCSSIFGMAVGVAPVFGPVLGGYLAEAYSWRWSFYMLVPVGVLSFIGMLLVLRNDERAGQGAVRLDRVPRALGRAGGGAARAGARRAARLVRTPPRSSSNASWRRVAFYVFIFHCLTATTPFLNLRLLTDRNYAIGLVLVTIYGMLNFTPMVLLPPLLQTQMGFPDALVGEVIGARGMGMMVGFMTAGFMKRLDPRLSMSIGFSLLALAGVWMMTFDLNVTMTILIANSLVQGFAVGVIWVPLSVVAFDTLAPKDRAEASSVFHLLRNIGSSFFISLSIAEIVRTTGANYSRMTEMITPYSKGLSLPGMTGGWTFDTVPGLAKVANEIARQAAMIGYLNAFMMYTVTSAAAVAIVLLVRRKKRA